MAKVMKSYRLEQTILDMLKGYCEKYDITETKAIEIAILHMIFTRNEKED